MIGVVSGTGGIADAISAFQASLGKATGAEVVYDSNPEELVERLLRRYLFEGYECPCYPGPAEAT